MHLPSLPTLVNLYVSLSLIVLVSLYVPSPEWLGLRTLLPLCKDDFCDYCCLAMNKDGHSHAFLDMYDLHKHRRTHYPNTY